jgi:tRNA pseudouridine32 synthase/23S rRNA pseudouridine746 synthase
MLAKTEDAHREANRWFEEKLIHKTYEALSEIKLPPEKKSYLWKSNILKGKKRAYVSPVGKLAVTQAEYEGTAKFKEQTVGKWKLSPLTGRSHQLRFEMAQQGFPILGDSLYGATLPFEKDGIALRAVALDFSRCDASSFDLPQSLEVTYSFLH